MINNLTIIGKSTYHAWNASGTIRSRNMVVLGTALFQGRCDIAGKCYLSITVIQPQTAWSM